MTTYKIIVSKDGEVKKTFINQDSDVNAFAYLLKIQPMSTCWAMKYEGWKVEQINEQTGVSFFWKHYNVV